MRALLLLLVASAASAQPGVWAVGALFPDSLWAAEALAEPAPVAGDSLVAAVTTRNTPPALVVDSLAVEAAARSVFAAARDSLVSPLDTLSMSVWERAWWGRHGMMRQVGLFPTHPDEPLDDLRQIATVRRRMLTWHQTLGLATVASMGATVIGGQIAASTGNHEFHEATLPVTIGLYSTTAALALLSPPKPITLDRGGGIDSITIHRWLAVGHVAGMIATPLLAEDAGQAHYIMGYTTMATFSAAMLAVTLLRR